MTCLSRTLLLVALILFAPRAAFAGLVAYEFTGTVSAITDTSGSHHYVPTGIQDGDRITGSFSYNPTTGTQTSGYPIFDRGVSIHSSVTIDGKYTYTLKGLPLSNPTGPEIDMFSNSFGLYQRGGLVATSPNNVPFSHFEFFGSPAGTSLANPQLTGTGYSFGISDQQSSNQPYWYIGASLTSLTAVPEPATLSLLLVGGVVAGGYSLRRRRT